ncbi:MAG: cell division protein FtsW [Legionellales bacterium RIFCSPHIGHO2_12_FULL_35_11]|nr:MAG: cell division protein FtsW [Legionellales bacterium RIFCSPHIGHO2_12_FULL_35_11]
MKAKRAAKNQQFMSVYDKWLIFSIVSLVIIGLMMVASSSVMISSKYFHTPFHFLIRQAMYLLVGIFFAYVVLRIDSSVWCKYSVHLLVLGIILLVLVLIPGVGRVVNGSRRWLAFGPISIQVSELVKLLMVVYISGYLVRHKNSVITNIVGFIKPMAVLWVVVVLLMLEPDFGATVVITSTVMAMLFLIGVKFRYYITVMLVVSVGLAIIAISAPYRMARLTAFLNPWADQFNSGYQLTQSLIAFGQGGWFGAGLGESVQKLLYLPESHTDFLFAVLAEELGLIGVLVVIGLYGILIYRGLMIGFTAFKQDQQFAAYTAYGLTFWLGLQAIINMGVNAGLLPTKGLTLPLLSYGGASLVVNCVALALLLRIDHENRWNLLGY